MAWSAYSTLLAPGDLVTAAHVAELLAAFDERMRAVQLPTGISSWSIDTGAQETLLRGSGLITHRVYVESSGTVTQTTLNALLQLLVNYFYRTSDIEDGVSTLSAYTYAQLEADTLAALTAAGAPITALNATVDNAGYWNFHREALRLLQWAARSLPDRISATKTWTPVGVTAAVAIADYAALGTSAGGGGAAEVYAFQFIGTYISNGVDLSGTNQVSEMIIPAISIFSSGWDLAMFHESRIRVSGFDYLGIESGFTIGSATRTFSAIPTVDTSAWRRPVETAQLTATGTLGATTYIAGWEDGGAHDTILTTMPYEPYPVPPGEDSEVRGASCVLDAVAAAVKPTWAYS